MTIAVIDIGTNTVLLLVADFDPSGGISTREYLQRVPRLGRGVDKRKLLQQDSMERVIQVLLEYRAVIEHHRPDHVIVCGTSAVRDAANRNDFSGLVQRRTGLDLEILSGEEEAHWTYRGAISGLEDVRCATVVDIGGGSTELSIGTATEIIDKTSFDLGSVRLTERLVHHDPPDPSEVAAVRSAVASALPSAPPSFSRRPGKLIGVAGTATTLALLAQQRKDFDIDAVSGFRLGREAVRTLTSQLQRLSSEEILRMAVYMEGRNDIITAGAIILEEVMRFLGAEEIIVSERGVRYGLAIREWERGMKAR